MSKPKVIKDFDKISEEMLTQINLAYPNGFEKALIKFNDRHGKQLLGLPFETEDKYYLIKVNSNQRLTIIQEDDDDDLDDSEERLLEELDEITDKESLKNNETQLANEEE